MPEADLIDLNEEIAPPGDYLGRSDEDIFSDLRLLRSSLDLVHHRIGIFRDTIQLMSHLPLDRPIVVLCDWDVLRRFISRGAGDHSEPFPLRHFFNHSSFDFTIPEGGYKEFTSWLARRIYPESPQSSVVNSQGKRNVFDFLQFLFGIETCEDDAAMRESVAKLLQKNPPAALHISRFLRVLENGRFIPEIAVTLREDELRSAEKAVKRQTRFWVTPEGEWEQDHRDRDERDKSDITNLAIVLTRCRQTLNEFIDDKEIPYYLLMSNTGPVHSAARELRGFSGHLELTARPDQIAVLNILKFGQNSQGAHAKATRILHQLEKLSAAISNQVAILQTLGADDTAKIQMDRIRRDFELLGDISTQLFGDDVLTLEFATNALMIGMFNQKQQQSRQTASSYDAIPGSLLHLLDRMNMAFKQIGGVNYSLEPLNGTSVSYKSSVIDLARGKGESDLFKILLTKFLISDGHCAFWRAEFIHQRQDVDLIRFLKAALVEPGKVFPFIAKASEVEREIELCEAMPAKGAQYGVFISTSGGCFRIPPSVILRNGWETIRMFDLQRIMRQNGILSADGLHEIQSIHVNTLVCDIIFEIIPPEGIVLPSIILMSHFHIPTFIMKAIDFLGTRLVVDERLFRCIKDWIPKDLPHSMVLE